MEAGVVFRPTTRVVGFDGGEAETMNPFTGRRARLGPYDSIVLASPGLPRDALAAPLAARGISHRVIGDAYAPRDVEAAILDGFHVGAAL
jgi:hypothetical protein